jgi:putative ABC transport system ATP-binding protein
MDEPLLLSVSRLTRGFVEGGRRIEVLAGVDLSVEAGERVALLGPSGCGKSTLLNLIAGIDRPDGGDIRFRGSSIWAMDETARTLYRRRHIGFVYQFFNLLPTLTVRENVLLPLELNGMLGGAAEARAIGWLDELGLGGRLDAFPDRLSGGEQQRVALVRALAHGPALVLADEPTGNLDADSGARVLDRIDELVARTGCALLLVTHSPAVAERADRLVRLDHGRLEPGIGPAGTMS